MDTFILVMFGIVATVIVARLFILDMIAMMPIFAILFACIASIETAAIPILLLIFLWVSAEPNKPGRRSRWI